MSVQVSPTYIFLDYRQLLHSLPLSPILRHKTIPYLSPRKFILLKNAITLIPQNIHQLRLHLTVWLPQVPFDHVGYSWAVFCIYLSNIALSPLWLFTLVIRYVRLLKGTTLFYRVLLKIEFTSTTIRTQLLAALHLTVPQVLPDQRLAETPNREWRGRIQPITNSLVTENRTSQFRVSPHGKLIDLRLPMRLPSLDTLRPVVIFICIRVDCDFRRTSLFLLSPILCRIKHFRCLRIPINHDFESTIGWLGLWVWRNPTIF